MTDEKKTGDEYVEKRLKPTLIRRRAKVATDEPAVKEEVPPPAPAAPEMAAKDTAEDVKKPVEAAPAAPAAVEISTKPSAPAAPVVPAGAVAAKDRVPTSPSRLTLQQLGVVVPSSNAKDDKSAIKVARKKKSRAEWEEEEIKRAGGYINYASEIIPTDVDAAPEPERVERVYRPMASKRRRSVRKEFHHTVKTESKAIKRVIRIEESITVAELSQRMGVKSNEILKRLMGLGLMATVNQGVDVDTATLIAQEYGFEITRTALNEEEMFNQEVKKSSEGDQPRSPIVTVMGHVDHGKTSLLDAIRSTKVAAGEAGGITQHIGASVVTQNDKTVTFIDTPGHEAFTAMRSRGSKVTDIVILVVAADDGIMPQTKEAISHSKAAGVPIIVAINKIDKPEANPDRIMRELSENGLLPEDWGGDIITVRTSAKTGEGLDKLIEMVLLQAEVMELKANPGLPAEGTVLEAKLEKGRGPVATVLVQRGTLKKGAPLVCGMFSGRVRAMYNHIGQQVDEAGPSSPVEIIGLEGVPEAGDRLQEAASEKDAKTISESRQRKQREKELSRGSRISLEDLSRQIAQGEVKTLNLIVKADTQGSAEALGESFAKLGNDKVKVEVLHRGIGGVTENDIMLAAASNGAIIGFNVVADLLAQKAAERESVEVRTFTIIYEAIDAIQAALEGLLEPVRTEMAMGRIKIQEVFKVSKVGVVAGCLVISGKVTRNAKIRLLRDNVIIHSGTIASLKRFKDDVREVEKGQECGIQIDNFQDIKEGDEIEAYVVEEKKGVLG